MGEPPAEGEELILSKGEDPAFSLGFEGNVPVFQAKSGGTAWARLEDAAVVRGTWVHLMVVYKDQLLVQKELTTDNLWEEAKSGLSIEELQEGMALEVDSLGAEVKGDQLTLAVSLVNKSNPDQPVGERTSTMHGRLCSTSIATGTSRVMITSVCSSSSSQWKHPVGAAWKSCCKKRMVMRIKWRNGLSDQLLIGCRIGVETLTLLATPHPFAALVRLVERLPFTLCQPP